MSKKNENKEIITNNSEILFIYDAKLTNPNGDMDNENKPRMDYDTDTNLVSDVRLKRYIRDYYEKALEQPIFITHTANNSEDRIKQLGKGTNPISLIDCKLFGAVLADADASGYIGPIQFNWGYSLNPVEINESSTITSSFAAANLVGKDFRVKYSLIAFNGSINANTAKKVELEKNDVLLFDKVIIKSIPFCRTRSKIGQTPRFYMRVELINDKATLKDLREYIAIDYNKGKDEYQIRSIQDYSLNLEKLFEYLEREKDLINSVHIWIDESLNISFGEKEIKETKEMKEISLKDTDIESEAKEKKEEQVINTTEEGKFLDKKGILQRITFK